MSMRWCLGSLKAFWKGEGFGRQWVGGLGGQSWIWDMRYGAF